MWKFSPIFNIPQPSDHAPNFFLVAKPETISIILHDIRAKILVVIQKISLAKSLKRVWLKK